VSQENVELIRRGVAHLIETGEPLWELIDPQVVIEPDPFGPFGGRTYVGHEGLQSWTHDITEVATEAWPEIDDVIDAGDSVVVLGRNWTRGRYSDASGGELVGGLPFAWVCRLRDGRLVHLRVYLRQAEALEAVGLSE
jgi:ketosteroid isomerase-like protein